jgi:ribosomal protein S21
VLRNKKLSESISLDKESLFVYTTATLVSFIFSPEEVYKHMSDIKRKKGESFDAFLRRVKRRWLMSGRTIEARKHQHFLPEVSRNRRRTHAVKRTRINERTTYLKKIGRLKDEDETTGR